MSRIPNPYFAGPPATHPDTFFGREDVLRFVDDTLASPMHNVIVFYGQRRIGKTSILHQIAHRSSQNYQAVFFDLQSSVASPAHELLFEMAREMASQLKLPAPERSDFQYSSDAFRTLFLPHVYEHLGSRRLLLMLDEFDALSPETAPAELDALPFVKTLNRIIQSEDRRAVFLFVVGRRLKDLSSQQLHIFRVARDRQITLLPREDTLQLITRPAQGILTYQEAAVERIWTLASGHPYFTQLLCREIFNRAQRQNARLVTEAEVEAAIDEAIDSGQSALQWFWDEVPPIERFTLYTIGQLADEREGVTLEQLIDQRDAQRAQVDELALRALPDQLVDRQVLKRDAEQRYYFAVELVRHWVIHSHSLEEVTTDLSRAATGALAEALFETGRAAYRANDMDRAIEYFSQALSIDANYVDARLWLARAYLKAGNLLVAINEFVNVDRFGGPQQREARLGMIDARGQYGRQLEDEGKVEQAKQEYQRVLELDPLHELASARLSRIFQQQADERLAAEGLAAALPLYLQALQQYSADVGLEGEIKEHLEQYSQAQEAAGNRQEVQRASRLAATLMPGAGDRQEMLLRVQLERGNLYLGQHELESAADIYRRLLQETAGGAPFQTIENDILRYSQQQEEQNNWSRVEAALTLLIELFPDGKNRSQLTDSLCRQGEFYLGQDDLIKAKAAYQRALAGDPTNQALRGLIRAGFQTYRRARAEDKTVQTRKSVEAAMLVMVEVLGQDDILARQWLSEARMDLGDAWQAGGKPAEAQSAYLQALDNLTRLLGFVTETDQVYRFGEVAEHIGRVLACTVPDEEVVSQIKITFHDYCHRQEARLRWNHARRAMEILCHLFPGDQEARFWLAETQAEEADWHLQRAIPDLDEAQRLARSALDVNLPDQQKTDLITAHVKESFRAHSLEQEATSPPNWTQAEQIMNRLVSLFPSDPTVQRWLAETRQRQGDWYLAQEGQPLREATRNIVQAAEVYERALRELPNDDGLVAHLKSSFRTYRDRRAQQDPPARSLAKQAIQSLTELLPEDEEARQWLAEIEKADVPAAPLERLKRRWPVAIGVTVLTLALCLGVGFASGAFNFLASTPSPPAATATQSGGIAVVPSSVPPNTATPTGIVTPAPTDTAAPSPTGTAAPSPTDTATPAPTDTATITPQPPPPTVVLNCDPPGGSDLSPGSTVALSIEGEGELVPTWTVLHGTLNPSDGVATIYTAPDTPGADVVSVAIKSGDYQRTFSCSYNILPFPPPMLVGPSDRTVFRGNHPPPRLEWAAAGELGQDKYYLVKLEFLRNGNPSPYKMWLKGTSWEVPPEVFHLADHPAGLTERQIRWQVVVVRKDGTELSGSTETRTFTWQSDPLPSGEALDVAVNPKNGYQVLAVLKGNGIYKSDNGGIDWQRVSASIPDERTIEVLHIAPADPRMIYAGAFGYILISKDYGENWRLSPILPRVQVHAIATDPDDANVVFAATDRGLLRSSDGGLSWLTLDRAEGYDGDQVLNRSFYSVVTLKTSQGNRVYTAGEGDQIYWRGTDDASAPWRMRVCKECAPPILALAVDPQSPGKLLAGSNEGRLAVSSNGGYDWSRATIPSSISTLKFSVLAMDPASSQIVYAGSGTHRNPTDGQGLYRSQDGGKTWERFWPPGRGTDAVVVQDIAFTPADGRAILIAGSEGVFRSDDGGSSWTKQ